MKRIKNTFLTLALVLVIAVSGMTSVTWLLKKTETQELDKKTEMLHEEITLNEEETDHLVLVLKALEENNLTKKAVGSGVSIPESKAWDMVERAMDEMQLLGLQDYLYIVGAEGEQWQQCELVADVNNLSLEMYQIRILILEDWYGFEMISILDARSGLLISQDLTFMTREEAVAKLQEGYYSDYVGYYGEYGNVKENGVTSIDGTEENDTVPFAGQSQGDGKWLKKGESDKMMQELGMEYTLKVMLGNANNYYSYNTNFDFSIKKESENYYRMDSRDGEYYLELKQEDRNFHFQLHKFDL